MYFSHRVRARPRELNRFVRLLTVIQSEIAFTLRPTGTLLESLAARDEFSDFSFLQFVRKQFSGGVSLQDAWSAGVKTLQKERLLFPDEIALIQAFGAGFGSTGPEEQSANCAYFISQLTVMRERAAEAGRSKSRLYSILGVLGGVFLALLFL